MAIKYDILCLTNGSKLSFLHRSSEMLRREYNKMGDWHREGITVEVYQTLKLDVRQIHPYYPGKLSISGWRQYIAERFMVKTRLIQNAMAYYDNACGLSNTYSGDLDNIKDG